MTEPEESDTEPESPDLGAMVQAETGDTLDGPPGKDGLDAGYVAPSKPFFLDDPDTTPDGQRAGDTLDERLQREVPDDADLDGAASADVGRTTGEIGSEAGQGRSGRLAADETAADTSTVGSLDADDAGISGGAASAEEAAVHDIDENEIDGLADLAAEDGPGGPEGPDVRLRDDEVDPASGGADDRT